MARRYRVGWMGLIPFIGYHHMLMILIAAAIIFLSLLLAGCSSSAPLIPDIFLISFYYQPYNPSPSTAQVDFNVYSAVATVVGSAKLAVKVGYFGICVNVNRGSWLCSNNATALANDINSEADPLNLVWLADQFKDMIVFPYLIIIALVLAFICVLLLATFPGWHEEERYGSEVEVKPFPSRRMSQTALSAIFTASIFVFVSILWQHTASVGASTLAQDLGNGSVLSGVGSTSMVLGWFGFALLIIVALGLLVMIIVMGELANIPSPYSSPKMPISPPRPVNPPVVIAPPRPQPPNPPNPPAVIGHPRPQQQNPPAVIGHARPNAQNPPAVIGHARPQQGSPPAVIGHARPGRRAR